MLQVFIIEQHKLLQLYVHLILGNNTSKCLHPQWLPESLLIGILFRELKFTGVLNIDKQSD